MSQNERGRGGDAGLMGLETGIYYSSFNKGLLERVSSIMSDSWSFFGIDRNESLYDSLSMGIGFEDCLITWSLYCIKSGL